MTPAARSFAAPCGSRPPCFPRRSRARRPCSTWPPPPRRCASLARAQGANERRLVRRLVRPSAAAKGGARLLRRPSASCAPPPAATSASCSRLARGGVGRKRINIPNSARGRGSGSGRRGCAAWHAPPLNAPASRWRSGLGSAASENLAACAGAPLVEEGGVRFAEGASAAARRPLRHIGPCDSAAAASATSAPTPTPTSAAQLRRSESSKACTASRLPSSRLRILAWPRGTRVRATAALLAPSLP